MLPYSQGHLLSSVFKVACMTMFPGNREVNHAIADLALSRKTVTSRIENISNHIFEKLLYNPKKANCYSTGIDQSTDNEDITQILSSRIQQLY